MVNELPKEPYSWARAMRFYRRNDTTFWCLGCIFLGHVFWWQVQQNRAFVDVHDRRRTLGPIPVVYIDELEFFKKKPEPLRIQTESKPNE